MSNLSDIGFPVQGEHDVNEILMATLKHSRQVMCDRGIYLVFSDDSGAEIYLQGNAAQELIGFNPHFGGTSKRSVGLTAAIERESSELDGGFHAWFDPDRSGGDGQCPFVFDVPDFRNAGDLEFPKKCDIQLTAFASNDLQIFENEDRFLESEESGEAVGSKSFVSVGLNALEETGETDLSLARPIAWFTGDIKTVERKTNSLTDEDFFWLLVETLGGEIDVVADPKLVTGTPQTGHIVKGTFWLSARILS